MPPARRNNGNPNAGDYTGLGPDYAGPYAAAYGRGVNGMDAIDRLQGIIERARAWPIWSADHLGGIDTGTYAQMGMYGKSLRDIALWVAMRESDRDQLIQLTNWERDRPMHIDPLPERISMSYSDLLYGEEPKFIAADESDQDNMDNLATETALASELRRWVDCFVSEGEYWWRAWTDLDASEWPLVSAHSRLNVLPLFVGRKIVAAAFVDNILTQEVAVENQVRVVFWRHVEIHAVGCVRNLLYKGTIGTLGDSQPLDQLPETQDLEQDWEHNLPVMLAGRFVNKLGRDFRVGISEYQGVRDLLLDLNEARTIMAENARLVLKARMVVPASAIDAEGNFDSSKDVIVQESLDDELGAKQGGSYTVLEYTFRARELLEHKDNLVLDIMARCGLAEQFATSGGRGGGGQAFTGTALRTKLIPTVQAASGKGREVDEKVPVLLSSLAQLSALPQEDGGCGQSWANAKGPHIQKRSNMLPEDPNEEVQRHVMAVQGEVESIQTAVTDMHGEEWSDEEIELEVERIRADRSSGPSYAQSIEDLESQQDEEIPNVPPGGPGSAVPTPNDLLGSAQPGVGTPPVSGESPGTQPPQVVAGGPK